MKNLSTTNDNKSVPTKDMIPAPSASDPVVDGTASAGSSATYSRGDHVHPTDTTRAAVTSVAASASINASGLITFKNSSNTAVFTLQLPLYSGSVTSV